MHIEGKLIDLFEKDIYPARISIEGERIVKIEKIDKAPNHYLCPGFVDAHVHVESSMLPPAEFGRIALAHGTVATVSDPHEIANVLGIEGIRYMIDESRKTKLKICFGAPSCVPATSFETSGAILNPEKVCEVLDWPEIGYLSEVMNFPAVIHGDPGFIKMINHAKKLGKPVDGHAPGLIGKAAVDYAAAGIETDHECYSINEALQKIGLGMKILIREGSAAKNYNVLAPLLKSHPEICMFCSDDKHPDELLLGHINELVERSIKGGYHLFDVLKVACHNPVEHYKLDVGQLREGDKADFVVLEDIKSFKVLKTFIDGEQVSSNGKSIENYKEAKAVNFFKRKKIELADLKLFSEADVVPVIEALDRQLITNRRDLKIKKTGNEIQSDPNSDVLKITVVNRYSEAEVSVALISNFGLKNGAIASSVAHDSHNIVAVGSDDVYLKEAINMVIENKGGIAFAGKFGKESLKLDIAGLMSTLPAEEVGSRYAMLDQLAKKAGSKLSAPFMTLSFMALLVIPSLKLSDKGLFDGDHFEYMSF